MLCVEGSVISTETSQDSIIHLEQVWHTGLHLLEAFQQHISEGMLGMLCGVFEGDAPHVTRYTATSATSTGEILRVYNLLTHLGIRYQKQLLTI